MSAGDIIALAIYAGCLVVVAFLLRSVIREKQALKRAVERSRFVYVFAGRAAEAQVWAIANEIPGKQYKYFANETATRGFSRADARRVILPGFYHRPDVDRMLRAMETMDATTRKPNHEVTW